MSLRKTIRGADHGSRRTFLAGMAQSLLGVGAAATFGPSGLARALNGPVPTGSLFDELQDPQDPKPIVLGPATAKHVIYLFMSGGMSHIDTLDPKPGAATNGPNTPIDTRADGVLLGSYLPKLAQQMDKCCIVSSMSSTQGAHAQASYLMRTSYELRGTIEHPSTGAWVHRMAGRLNETLPGHVIIGGGADIPAAGFFPASYQPVPLGTAEDGLQNCELPRGVSEKRFNRRLEMLGKLDRQFAETHRQLSVGSYSQAYRDAVKLMRSSDLVAFDIDQEPDSLREAYGENRFGAGCLLARRLVEHGVRYVEVFSGGWDTHSDNFDRLADLTPAIDQGLSALLADLDARGLLQDTLVVLASEFGRTPDIDEDQGRNHYPKAFSTLLAGGGVRGGQRYGKTDKEGREVVSDPVSIPDFNATIAHACGLPTDHILYSPSGRPFRVGNKGMPVTEIFA
ncbi:MAG TPA: DUF1501 domain-containing protein [bacterium]|nr:DUF1501 domain-containing protein [bacterium]